MEVNTTCGLRGSCICYNQNEDINITAILYLFTIIWIAIFIISIKKN